MKDSVYKNKPKSIAELNMAITHQIREIQERTTVIDNFAQKAPSTLTLYRVKADI